MEATPGEESARGSAREPGARGQGRPVVGVERAGLAGAPPGSDATGSCKGLGLSTDPGGASAPTARQPVWFPCSPTRSPARPGHWTSPVPPVPLLGVEGPGLGAPCGGPREPLQLRAEMSPRLCNKRTPRPFRSGPCSAFLFLNACDTNAAFPCRNLRPFATKSAARPRRVRTLGSWRASAARPASTVSARWVGGNLGSLGSAVSLHVVRQLREVWGSGCGPQGQGSGDLASTEPPGPLEAPRSSRPSAGSVPPLHLHQLAPSPTQPRPQLFHSGSPPPPGSQQC